MEATDRSGAGGLPRPRTPSRSKDELRVTIEQLFEEFLAFSEARGRSPTTLHAYRTAIAGSWRPRIGDMEIGALTAHALDTIYAGMLTRDRPAAPSTVRKYHAILSAALAQAVKWQWIPVNPARLATLPDAQHADPKAPTPEQVRALIAECSSESEVLGMFVLVAAVTGCRRGELAALRWGDHSAEGLRVHGSAYNIGRKKGVKPTKTGRERRVVVGSHLELAIQRWKARCEFVAADVGAAFGPDCLIFSGTPDGLGPINVNTVTSVFHRVATRLGMSSIHLHSLRHFAATQLISAGVDPRTAASRLGHANPSMTLRVYAHPTSETEQHAAEVSASVLIEPR